MLMSNPTEMRSPKDIQLITSVLEETQLSKKFKNSIIDDNSTIRLISSCALYMTNQFIPKGEYIFKIGEIGEFFYLILKGSVEILRVVSYTDFMRADEYYSILLKYYKNNDIYLLNETLTTNFHYFPIRKHEFEALEERIQNIKYEKSVVKRVIYSTHPEFNELFLKFQSNSNVNIDMKDDPLDKRIQYFEYDEEIVKESDLPKKKVTIFIEEWFLKKNKGEFFGDLALDQKYGTRNASCRAIEDCYMGLLTKEQYQVIIMEEKNKLRFKEIGFLIDNYIFKKVTKQQFDKKYYNSFVLIEYEKGSVLTRENEEMQTLYFLREGEVELSINKSIIQLTAIINDLKQRKGSNAFSSLEEKSKYNIRNGNL